MADTDETKNASTDEVKAHIERTIDHLAPRRVSREQLPKLRRATEQAERVSDSSDAALGRVTSGG